MKHIKNIIILCILLSSQSCVEGAKGMQNWIEATSIEQVQGKYHLLADDGIKIYLPSPFKKLTTEEYKKIIKAIITPKAYKIEDIRLENLKKLDGNFNIFFDEETRSTFTLNTLPYQPIYKRDAQFLLGQIRLNYENSNNNPDVTFTKVTAKYNADRGPQIFKAVFKMEDSSTATLSYISTYVISANKKTVWIQLQSPYKNGVDDYLNKLIM